LNTIIGSPFVLAAAETQEMTRLFDLDWQLLSDSALMIVAIFVLFLFMSHFLFNPARKFLADRQNRIKNDLDTAQSEKADAIALKEDYEAKLRDIDKQAEEILGDARKKALANEADIVAKAKEEAARIIDRARVEAELEKKKAADDVKREMIQVASAMAGKVVAANIDTTVSDGLIDETLKEIGESTWLD
jgi:F-type H+-transporting ATPase subunit b